MSDSMAADSRDTDDERRNLLEEALEETRERYRAERGEEPSEAFMEDARRLILRQLAKKGRDEHRDIYEKLAEE
jgi:hypothetical protein